MRKVHTKRYNKQVPGHHIQMDVKFLTFTGKCGEKIRRFLSNCPSSEHLAQLAG